MKGRFLTRRQSSWIALVTFGISAITLGAANAQESPSSLPGGASSEQETYQDWRVACVQTKVKHCAMLQQQARKGGQRVLSMELAAGTDGQGATGTLVLPFGLALHAGVSLQIDDQPVGDPLAFKTCLPAGCVVPIEFAAGYLGTLRTGTALKVLTKASDSGQVVPSRRLELGRVLTPAPVLGLPGPL